MHLHSPFIQNAKQGVSLIFLYFLGVIVPAWALGSYIMKLSGAALYPSLRPGKDHDHMAPRLMRHLKENNFEAKDDFLGRRNG